MSICKNKTFNKFLFFSLFFLFVSLAVNSVIVFAAETSERKKACRKNAVQIQVEQKKILNHLERIENKVIISKRAIK